MNSSFGKPNRFLRLPEGDKLTWLVLRRTTVALVILPCLSCITFRKHGDREDQEIAGIGGGKEQVIEKSRWDTPLWTEVLPRSALNSPHQKVTEKESGLVHKGGLAFVNRFEDQDLLKIDQNLIKSCQKDPCRNTRLDHWIATSKAKSLEGINSALLVFLSEQSLSPRDIKRLAPILEETSQQWAAEKVEIADLYYEKKKVYDPDRRPSTTYTLWILTIVPPNASEEILRQLALQLGTTNDPATLAVTRALRHKSPSIDLAH